MRPGRRRPRRKCGRWVAFRSAVSCLVRKHVVGFCIKMRSSGLPWFRQALSFLGSSGTHPVGLRWPCPHPRASSGLSPSPAGRRGPSLSVRSTRGREGVCCPSHPPRFRFPHTGGRVRHPPRGPQAPRSALPHPPSLCCPGLPFTPRLPPVPFRSHPKQAPEVVAARRPWLSSVGRR